MRGNIFLDIVMKIYFEYIFLHDFLKINDKMVLVN